MTKRKRPYHRDNLEAELLVHAAEILATEGLEALSLRELGRRANVSRSAPYHYFPDKAGLLAKVGRHGFTRLKARILAAVGQETDPARRLRAGLHGYVDFALEESSFFRLMFANLLDRTIPADLDTNGRRSPFSSLEAAEAFGTLIGGVVDWLRTRPQDQRDPVLVTQVFWSYAHGIATLAVDQNFKHAQASSVLDCGLDALLAPAGTA
jgi:AcrR family transcriptional regulator